LKLGKRIGVGATAEVYELDEKTIIKLFRSYMPVGKSKHEYENAAELNRYDIPIPPALDYVEYAGRVGIVYERVSGKSMLRDMLNPLETKKDTEQLADLHFAIHQIKPSGFISFKKLLSSNIEQTEILSDHEKEIILQRLEALPDGDALCHGDFHPDNILLTAKGPVILDWMTAGVGDPAADVARTGLILRTSEPPVNLPQFVRRYVKHFGQKVSEIYLRTYCKKSGLTQEQIDAWSLPVAAARLLERRPDNENKILLQIIKSAL
jgi:aminoglycoside phosphotransferase (APT) family kinase protein